MNAYLFTGLVSQYQHGHFVDACQNVILYGGDEDACWKAFEEGLVGQDTAENPILNKIEKMVGAPVLEQLFTEAGSSPIVWPELAEEAQRVLEATPVDDQEQGYWADCDQEIRPDKLPPTIEWLQKELPEEIRSGLNWSADKTYFFLISVLSPPAPPAEIVEDPETDLEPGQDGMTEGDDGEGSADSEIAQRLAAFPQLAEKELAVVVRARNSIVATWLWRRYAASTPLANHAIRVDALCAMAPVGSN